MYCPKCGAPLEDHTKICMNCGASARYPSVANVPTNRYNQKWMLETILEAQEDVKGEMPSYQLGTDAFHRLNETLLKYGYISKPVVYKRFTGDNQ